MTSALGATLNSPDRIVQPMARHETVFLTQGPNRPLRFAPAGSTCLIAS